jgi:hypothetical protein
MQALRLIKETPEDGIVKIEVPKNFGKKIEVIVMPASEKNSSVDAGLIVRERPNDDELFLAASYQAIIEEDEEEDAIWRSYIK